MAEHDACRYIARQCGDIATAAGNDGVTSAVRYWPQILAEQAASWRSRSRVWQTLIDVCLVMISRPAERSHLMTSRSKQQLRVLRARAASFDYLIDENNRL